MEILREEDYKFRKGSLNKRDMSLFVDFLSKDYKVYGPVKKGTEHIFGPIKTVSDLELEYQTTILPPKKLLHQPFETMFHFTTDGNIKEEQNSKEKQVLLGVHPCDVNAIAVLDKVYMHEYPDPYYKRKRNNTIIIALNCNTVGETCFCSLIGTGPILESKYDILMTNLGNEYLLEAGSKVGDNILEKIGISEASDSSILEKQNKVSDLMKKVPQPMPAKILPKLLEKSFRHPIWDKLAKECLACGSCTMVCPTCFCYNVIDQIDLDLKNGQRQRVWDSCLILEFGEVAMGGNFRRDRDARIKQRIYHKMKYMSEQFGKPGCVGCGRCIKACIKGIDPRKIVAELREEII